MSPRKEGAYPPESFWYNKRIESFDFHVSHVISIQNSKSGALKTLGDSLRRHPEDLLLTLPGEFEKILHSGCCAHVEVCFSIQIHL